MKLSEAFKIGLLTIVIGLFVNLLFAAFVSAGNQRITDFTDRCSNNHGIVVDAGSGFLTENLKITHLCISKENGIIDAMER